MVIEITVIFLEYFKQIYMNKKICLKKTNKQVFNISQNLSCHKPPGSSYVTVLPCDVSVFGPNIIIVSHISKRNQLKLTKDTPNSIIDRHK